MEPYNNPIARTQKPISEADLTQVEEELGFRFPPEIREHYLRYNGGRPKRDLFLLDDDERVRVDNFLPVKYGMEGADRLEEVCRDLRNEEQIIPEWLIPFAIDPGGEYFCFSIREEDRGAIHFFWGEFYDDPDRAITYLAPSLRAFIEGMVEDAD